MPRARKKKERLVYSALSNTASSIICDTKNTHMIHARSTTVALPITCDNPGFRCKTIMAWRPRTYDYLLTSEDLLNVCILFPFSFSPQSVFFWTKLIQSHSFQDLWAQGRSGLQLQLIPFDRQTPSLMWNYLFQAVSHQNPRRSIWIFVLSKIVANICDPGRDRHWLMRRSLLPLKNRNQVTLGWQRQLGAR